MMLCIFDGPLVWQKETETTSASVGMICKWGGITIAEISPEVPEGERDGYARMFAASWDLFNALDGAANSAGFQYMTNETQDAINTALAKARGEQ